MLVSSAEQFFALSFSLKSFHYVFSFHSVGFSSLDFVTVQACEVLFQLSYLQCLFFFGDLVIVHLVLQATRVVFQVSSSSGCPSSSLKTNNSFLEFLLYLVFINSQQIFQVQDHKYFCRLGTQSNKRNSTIRKMDFTDTLQKVSVIMYICIIFRF